MSESAHIIPESILYTSNWNDACAVMRQLIAEYKTPDARDEHRRTALHWAVIAPETWRVHAVLQFPVDINAQDIKRETPILIACRKGHLNVVILLAGAGANIEIYDAHSDSPLLWAAFEGHLDVVMFLVEELEADVDHRYSDGRPALFWAANKSKRAVVEYLYFITPSRISVDNSKRDFYSQLIAGNLLDLWASFRMRDMMNVCHYYARNWNARVEIQTLKLIREFLYGV